MTDPATARERALREEETRRYVRAPFLEDFDREFAAEFGRYPSESPLAGTRTVSPRRREAIQTLIERGATEGEREAARSAMARLDSVDSAKVAETERSVGFGWRPSQTAHDLTEQGNYYARDALAGSSDDE